MIYSKYDKLKMSHTVFIVFEMCNAKKQNISILLYFSI